MGTTPCRSCQVTIAGATATITVTTHTVSVIPGVTPTITQSAALPVERLT